MSVKQPVHNSFREFGKRRTTPQEVVEKVEELVRRDLEGRFQDGFVFDPIIVNPELDHCGDEFLHIYIIYDGDRKKLDPKWTLGMEGRLFDQLSEDECPLYAGHSFIPRFEWKKVYKERIQ